MRFHKVARLADEPTPLRRLIAAAVAGSLAFLITQVTFGLVWGGGSSAAFFSAIALAVAAALAALTMKRAMAIVYGLLAAVWVLLEMAVALIAGIVACIG